MPIPGTSATGAFAQKPMIKHPMKEIMIVATIPASNGIPASDKIIEFTAMM
ncbi:hypothetical protein J5TS2_11140 [Brevibacillus halotolerans]|nr:hypothetical protein J5TS2_11140 [Brevibacillus halotolerans]